MQAQDMYARMDDFERRLQRVEEHNTRFDQIDRRFDQMDARFDRIDGKAVAQGQMFVELQAGQGRIESKVDRILRHLGIDSE